MRIVLRAIFAMSLVGYQQTKGWQKAPFQGSEEEEVLGPKITYKPQKERPNKEFKVQPNDPILSTKKLISSSIVSISIFFFQMPMTLAHAMLILRFISVAELDNEKEGAGILSK